MEWIKRLTGQTVGLDTAPLICFIENHPLYYPLVEPFFAAVERVEIEVVTSTRTLAEVLVHPYRHGNQVLAREYSDILLGARNVTTFRLRQRSVRRRHASGQCTAFALPDAIQLATAHKSHAGSFLTNDEDLERAAQVQMLLLKRMVP